MNRLFYFFFLFALCLCSSCATRGTEAQPVGIPVAPVETRLGFIYLSALGERCYELIPKIQGPSALRAICLRQGEWVVLPPVYTNSYQNKFSGTSKP
jgi:hypothetical protein